MLIRTWCLMSACLLVVTTLLTFTSKLIADELSDSGQLVYSTRPYPLTTHIHLFDVSRRLSVFVYHVDDIVQQIYWSDSGDTLLLLSDGAQIHVLDMLNGGHAQFLDYSYEDSNLIFSGWLDDNTAIVALASEVRDSFNRAITYREVDIDTLIIRDFRYAIAPAGIWQSPNPDVLYYADAQEQHLAQLNRLSGDTSIILDWNPLELAYGSFQLSPDSRYFSANGVWYSSAGKSDMFLLDMQTGEINKLTQPDSQSGSANFWSDGGNELAYLSTDRDAFNLNLVDIRSQQQESLYSLPRPRFLMRLVGWSPDNTQLGYIEGEVGKDHQLCFLNMDIQTSPHCMVTLHRRSIASWRPE